MIELGPDGNNYTFRLTALWQIIRFAIANQTRNLLTNILQLTVPSDQAYPEAGGTVVAEYDINGQIDAESPNVVSTTKR